jgi:hypothetical protein
MLLFDIGYGSASERRFTGPEMRTKLLFVLDCREGLNEPCYVFMCQAL